MFWQDPFEDLVPPANRIAPTQRPRIQGPPRQPAPQTQAQIAVDQGQAAAAPYAGPAAAANLERTKLQNEEDRRRQETRQQAQNAHQDYARNVLTAIGDARRLSSGWSTGIAGQLLGDIGGTQAHDLQNQVSTVIANVGFDRLQQMRAESPTGGALGQVSDFENRMLQASLSSLSQSQSREQFERNLDRVELHYMNVLNTLQGRQPFRDLEEGRSVYQSIMTPPGQQRGGGPSNGGGFNVNVNSPPEDPNMLTVNVTGGRMPRNLGEASPELRSYMERAQQINPMLTFDQVMEDFRRPAGRRQYDPDSFYRMLTDQSLQGGNIALGPLSNAAFGLGGLETADAFRRGFNDVPTFGFADEIRGAVRSGIGGEDVGSAIQSERDIDRYDQQNNFGARLSGQVAGGFALPFPASGIGRSAAAGALYGGAYGFGSGDGGNRLRSGAAGAAIGGGLGALGGYLGNRGAQRDELLEAARRQGVDITRMEAGGVPTRMAAGVVGRTFGNVPMVEGARASSASAAAARDRIASNIGTVLDTAGAGQAAQRGARQFLEASGQRREQLFQRVHIAPNREASLSNTRAALQEMTQGMQSNPQLGAMFDNPELQGFLTALTRIERDVPTGILDQAGRPITRGVAEGGNLSWQDMRRFRSLIGEKIEQPTVAAEQAGRAALRRLYGAITTDMEATAAAESPRALTEMRRAIAYDRGRHARREGILTDILGPTGQGGAENAFEQINRWAQQRGGNFANVARALRSMPPDEANSVRASIFARMGQESAGRMDEAGGQVFNASTFATQWNNLSDRARSFLVPNGQHRRDLNDLVRITTAMRQSSQYQNFSNTSLGTNFVAFMAGLGVNPIATVSLAAGSLVAGKFLASRAGTGWLSRAARARTPGAQRSIVGSLTAVARNDPAIAQEALGLRRMLMQAMNDNAPQAGRAAASPPERPDDPYQYPYR